MLFELIEDDQKYRQPYLDDDSMERIITSISDQSDIDASAPIYLAKNWGEVTAEFDQTADEPTNDFIPDICFWFQFFLISEKALDLLKFELRGYCELLPLITEFGIYYLINIIQSQRAYSDSKQNITFSCHEQLISNQSLYRKTIKGNDTYFCTADFKQKIELYRLQGVKFEALKH